MAGGGKAHVQLAQKLLEEGKGVGTPGQQGPHHLGPMTQGDKNGWKARKAWIRQRESAHPLGQFKWQGAWPLGLRVGLWHWSVSRPGI